MIRRRFVTVAGTLLIASLAGCTSSGQRGDASSNIPASPVALRLAYFPNVTHAPALIGVADGTFQNEIGKAARVTPVIFLSGPSAMEALLAGEVDMAYVGISPAINAYIKSRGALKVVSGVASGGAVLVARADSGITKMEDLVGKRIGTPQKGGTQDIAARHYITQTLKQKLTDSGGTTQIVPTDSPQLATLFQQKALDAAWVQEPWGTRLIRELGAKLILDERDQWPNRRYATTVLVARTAFLQQHPDLVEAVVRAHIALSKRITADRAGAGKTIGSEIKRLTKRALAPQVIEESLGRIDFTSDPFPDTIQVQADRAFALGFLGRASPDLASFVDQRILSRATGSPAGGKSPS